MINYIVSLYQGRLSRLQFVLAWVYFTVLYTGVLLLLAVPAVIIVQLISSVDPDSTLYKVTLAVLVAVALIVVQVTGAIVETNVIVRRLHDLNRPWWYIIFAVIPLANIVLLVLLLLAPGTAGSNDYGTRVQGNSFKTLTKLPKKRRK